MPWTPKRRPLVTTGSRLEVLRVSLRSLSLVLDETPVGDFVVIQARLARPLAFEPVAPAGWRATASHRSHEALRLVDRDAGTGWSTGQRQASGQWLLVDLTSVPGRAARGAVPSDRRRRARRPWRA